jgi:hypothetical protein
VIGLQSVLSVTREGSGRHNLYTRLSLLEYFELIHAIVWSLSALIITSFSFSFFHHSRLSKLLTVEMIHAKTLVYGYSHTALNASLIEFRCSIHSNEVMCNRSIVFPVEMDEECGDDQVSAHRSPI